MRSFATSGLPRGLWLVVLGILLNYLGYGAVLSFEVIYLHDSRGFGLGLAGLTVALVTGVAVVAAPLAGPLIDRFGARAVAAVGGLALAAGYAGLAFAASPVPALAAAAVAGAGHGALDPSQSTLVATLAPAALRHHATGLSRVAANVGAAAGAGLGGLVASLGLPGFVGLFLANGLTYLAYVGILLAAVPRDARPTTAPGDGRSGPATGGYRTVARDRAFVRLVLVNVAMIAVGWGVFTWLVPPYAENRLGVGARLIGVLLLANAATVAVAQMPVARFAEGRRRAVMMAAGAGTFVVACALALAARPGAGYPPGTGVLRPGRDRRVSTHDSADAARGGPGPRGAARPVHGVDGPVLVGRAGDRSGARGAVAGGVGYRDVRGVGRGRVGCGRGGAGDGAPHSGTRAPDARAPSGWVATLRHRSGCFPDEPSCIPSSILSMISSGAIR